MLPRVWPSKELHGGHAPRQAEGIRIRQIVMLHTHYLCIVSLRILIIRYVVFVFCLFFVCSALEEDARAALSARQLFPLRGRNLKLEIAIKQSRKALAAAASQDEPGDVPPDTRNKKRPLEDKEKGDQEEGGQEEEEEEEEGGRAPAAQTARVQAAAKKSKAKKGGKKDSEAEAAQEQGQAEAEAGPSRQRQLLVLGLPAEVSKKSFQRFLQQMKGLRRGARPLVELVKEVRLCTLLLWIFRA